MKERLLSIIVCPICKSGFSLKVAEKKDNEIISGALICGGTHEYAIRGGIPRLVPSDSYVDSFSFEWSKFSKVQLDIFNGTRESEHTFLQKTGFCKDALRDKLVLDAGCGAGRFSDVVSRSGGEVVCIDLSYAVDAAYKNIGDRPNVHIIQADLFALPFKAEIFDYIFSIGVLHHTPDTHEAFKKLIPHLRRGGEVAVWVYARYYEKVEIISTILRRITTKMPKRIVYYLSSFAVPLYYIGPLRHAVFPAFQFSLHKDAKWRWLDTFDWYTPHYVWKHTYPEVFQWFKGGGLRDITPLEPPVAMRGRK